MVEKKIYEIIYFLVTLSTVSWEIFTPFSVELHKDVY